MLFSSDRNDDMFEIALLVIVLYKKFNEEYFCFLNLRFVRLMKYFTFSEFSTLINTSFIEVQCIHFHTADGKYYVKLKYL